jgi:pimeloyl-ACP methyl ester carboxylesterase
MTKAKLSPADYIVPLNMNGLQGRMMYMSAPAGKKREILFIYGHHSSLERWFGLAQVLNRYGAVTAPDLPGFGGMQSFYKIGKKPSIDNMADYLAAFVKMRYKRKPVTIVGLSFGFVVATRMLQRYPDLVKKVDMIVSVVGFAHKDDFTFSTARRWFYRGLSRIFCLPVASSIFRTIALHPSILRVFYAHTHNAKQKLSGLEETELRQMLDVEVWLWRNNELRTYMYTTNQMLRLDNCKKQIDLPIWHVGVAGDHFFDNELVEQHLQVVFKKLHNMKVIGLAKHAPTVIATEKDAGPFIPIRLRRQLSRS